MCFSCALVAENTHIPLTVSLKNGTTLVGALRSIDTHAMCLTHSEDDGSVDRTLEVEAVQALLIDEPLFTELCASGEWNLFIEYPALVPVLNATQLSSVIDVLEHVPDEALSAHAIELMDVFENRITQPEIRERLLSRLISSLQYRELWPRACAISQQWMDAGYLPDKSLWAWHCCAQAALNASDIHNALLYAETACVLAPNPQIRYFEECKRIAHFCREKLLSQHRISILDY
jgi:hypothetical protein